MCLTPLLRCRPMHANREINAEAAAQRGLVVRHEAMAAGLSHDAVDRRLQNGQLERVQPRVYRAAGAPVTWEQQLLGACRSTGGVASHRAAAALWGLDLPPGTLEVTVTRPRCPRPKGVVLHRSTDLRAEDVTVRFGIPVTNPLRTLLDLGAVLPPWLVDSAINSALAKKLVTLPGLEITLLLHGKKGRRGAGVLRRLLDERGGLVPESELEGRMHRLCRRHGLPLPQFQYVIRNGKRFIARVDFAYPELKVAIEVDGYLDHSSPDAFQRDRARQNDLVELGWIVLRFTWDDIVRHPEVVASRLRRILGAETR
jgi:restriction endonuclease-like protein